MTTVAIHRPAQSTATQREGPARLAHFLSKFRIVVPRSRCFVQ